MLGTAPGAQEYSVHFCGVFASASVSSVISSDLPLFIRWMLVTPQRA